MKKQRSLNSLQTRSRSIWAMKVLGAYSHEEIAALRRSTAATMPSALATADCAAELIAARLKKPLDEPSRDS